MPLSKSRAASAHGLHEASVIISENTAHVRVFQICLPRCPGKIHVAFNVAIGFEPSLLRLQDLPCSDLFDYVGEMFPIACTTQQHRSTKTDPVKRLNHFGYEMQWAMNTCDTPTAGRLRYDMVFAHENASVAYLASICAACGNRSSRRCRCPVCMEEGKIDEVTLQSFDRQKETIPSPTSTKYLEMGKGWFYRF